jgi:hypothetical protein
VNDCRGGVHCRESAAATEGLRVRRDIDAVAKPDNYGRAVQDLMTEGRTDRRTASQCLNFHNYSYEEALHDLLNR